jgi:hypothetical protein
LQSASFTIVTPQQHASDKVLDRFDLTVVRAIHAPLIDDLFSKQQERRADVRLSRPSAMRVVQ